MDKYNINYIFKWKECSVLFGNKTIMVNVMLINQQILSNTI